MRNPLVYFFHNFLFFRTKNFTFNRRFDEMELWKTLSHSAQSFAKREPKMEKKKETSTRSPSPCFTKYCEIKPSVHRYKCKTKLFLFIVTSLFLFFFIRGGKLLTNNMHSNEKQQQQKKIDTATQAETAQVSQVL